MSLILEIDRNTLPETNGSHLKIGLLPQKESIVFLSHPFSGVNSPLDSGTCKYSTVHSEVENVKKSSKFIKQIHQQQFPSPTNKKVPQKIQQQKIFPNKNRFRKDSSTKMVDFVTKLGNTHGFFRSKLCPGVDAAINPVEGGDYGGWFTFNMQLHMRHAKTPCGSFC